MIVAEFHKKRQQSIQVISQNLLQKNGKRFGKKLWKKVGLKNACKSLERKK